MHRERGEGVSSVLHIGGMSTARDMLRMYVLVILDVMSSLFTQALAPLFVLEHQHSLRFVDPNSHQYASTPCDPLLGIPLV